MRGKVYSAKCGVRFTFPQKLLGPRHDTYSTLRKTPTSTMSKSRHSNVPRKVIGVQPLRREAPATLWGKSESGPLRAVQLSRLEGQEISQPSSSSSSLLLSSLELIDTKVYEP